jgi:hypothetical protein
MNVTTRAVAARPRLVFKNAGARGPILDHRKRPQVAWASCVQKMAANALSANFALLQALCLDDVRAFLKDNLCQKRIAYILALIETAQPAIIDLLDGLEGDSDLEPESDGCPAEDIVPGLGFGPGNPEDAEPEFA